MLTSMIMASRIFSGKMPFGFRISRVLSFEFQGIEFDAKGDQRWGLGVNEWFGSEALILWFGALEFLRAASGWQSLVCVQRALDFRVQYM